MRYVPDATDRKLSLTWLQHRQSQKLFSEATHYWPSQSLLFAYAMACVQVVLLHEEADKSYQEAKDAWGLPDCQEVINGYKSGLNEIDAQIKRLCATGRKFKRIDTIPLTDAPEPNDDNYIDSTDFSKLLDSIAEFIKVGFNRGIDQANETWKVVPSLDAPWLYKAVTTWALGDYLGIKLEDWNKYKPLVRGGKSYDTEDIMTNKPTDRVHREVVSLFKRYGKLVHDKKLLKDAAQWYKCRVNPGTITDYLSELADQPTPIILERGRVSNDLAPYDEAIGYPRQWRK